MLVLAGVHHDAGRLAVKRSEYEAQLREQQHQEEVLRRLADPSTPEGGVAQKAYRRIGELLEELKLDESHLELATQVSYLFVGKVVQSDMYESLQVQSILFQTEYSGCVA